MALFSWQQVDPAVEQIEFALTEACHAARRRATRQQRLEAMAQAARSPSGSLSWGASPRIVTVTWWTDHVGRRHWYVEGDDYLCYGEPNPLWRCAGGAADDPLTIISPLHAAFRVQGDVSELLVVCDCGEVGFPEVLGWMGDCCAPCFDRRSEGAPTTSRLAVHAHATAATALAFTQNGRVLSVGYADGAVHLHDPNTGQGTLLAPPSEYGGVGAAILPDGSAVVAFASGEVVCWEVESGEERWRADCPSQVMGLKASADGERLALDALSVPYLFGPDGWVEGQSELSNFTFGPDGTLYACDATSRGVSAQEAGGQWVETGLTFDDQENCYALACSPARALLAAGLDNGRVRIGDPTAGRWLGHYERNREIVTGLAFTPDGRTLASEHEATVLFWDVEAGAERGELALPGSLIHALAFSPDGQTLAVGNSHGVVRLLPWRRMLVSGSNQK